MKILALVLVFLGSNLALALDLDTAELHVAKTFQLRLVGTAEQFSAYARATGATLDSVIDWVEATRDDFRTFTQGLDKSYCDETGDIREVTFDGFVIKFDARVITSSVGRDSSSGTVSFPIYQCYKNSLNLVGEMRLDVSQRLNGDTEVVDWFQLLPAQ